MKLSMNFLPKHVRPTRFWRSRIVTTLFALHAVLLTSTRVLACTPVGYLVLHAEDENKDRNQPFDLTLTSSGQAHAHLYIQMMNRFQRGQAAIVL